MSNVFLNVPGIGRLYLKETLVEYDFPLIFVCEDDYDSLYLFHQVDENDEMIKWQTVKITRQTYHDILSSKLSLQHVFREKQPTPFLLITHCFSDNTTKLDSGFDLQHKEIVEDEDVYLRDFIVSETDLALDLESLGDTSKLELELYPGQPIDALGAEIHSTISKEVDNIVRNMDPARYLEARIGIPKAASYTIPIVVTSSNAGAISASTVTKELANLLSVTNLTKNKLPKKEKILSSVKRLYESFAKTENDIILTYVNDDSKEKIANRIQCSEYSEKKNIISDVIESIEKNETVVKQQITGTLVAFNVRDGHFKIKPKSGLEIYGDIIKALKEENFTVGVNTSYDAVIENKGSKYLLISLKENRQLELNEE